MLTGWLKPVRYVQKEQKQKQQQYMGKTKKYIDREYLLKLWLYADGRMAVVATFKTNV